MSAGREFHVCGAATENARRASSVRTLGTVSSGASDDRSYQSWGGHMVYNSWIFTLIQKHKKWFSLVY